MSNFTFGRSKSKAKQAQAAVKKPPAPLPSPQPQQSPRRGALFMHYAEEPDVSRFPFFDTIVVDPQARFERPARSGKIYVYYALCEVGKTVPWFDNQDIPTVDISPTWGSKRVDIRDPRWTRLLLSLIRLSYASGKFDGVFFDTGDPEWIQHPVFQGDFDGFVRATADIIKAVKAEWPGKGIIPNRSFNAFPLCKDALTGFLFEGLYYGFSGQKSAAGTQELLNLAAPIKAAGLPVYVVDYLKVGQEALARQVADKIRGHGFLPLITVVELAEGRVLAS